MRTGLVFLALILLVATGCASMSKDECLLADWQSIGYEDGAAGRNASYLGEHRRACAKHGVVPNSAAYSAGHRDGLRTYCNYSRGHDDAIGGYSPLQVCPTATDYHAGFQEGLGKFCTYESGYEFGLAGGNYNRTCSSAREPNFLDGYESGSQIFALQSELSGLEYELEEVIAQRENNDRSQDKLKQQIILGEDLTHQDRAQILLDIDELRDIDDDLEEQEKVLEIQIAKLRTQLQGMGIESY